MLVFVEKDSLASSVITLVLNVCGLKGKIDVTYDPPKDAQLSGRPMLLVDGSEQYVGVFASLSVVCSRSLTAAGRSLLGASSSAQGDVEQWTTLAFERRPDDSPSIWVSKLSSTLVDRCFIVGDALSVADLALYALTHPTVLAMTDVERVAAAPLVRWFDLVQHIAQGLPHIEIKRNLAPEAKKEAKKEDAAQKKDKKDKKPSDDHATPTKQESNNKKQESQAPKQDNAGKQDNATKQDNPKKQDNANANKKEQQQAKPKKEPAKKPEAAAADDDKPLLARVDLRVGRIVDVMVNPNADGLYVEQIDLGEDKPRQIVSGLVKFVPIEEMRGALVVVLCNLKPSTLRQYESQGMVLAASNEDHTAVEIVSPPQGAQPGERIIFEGVDQSNPDAPFLNPKKKHFDALKPFLTTNIALHAVYVADGKELPFMTSKGVCTVKTLKHAHIG